MPRKSSHSASGIVASPCKESLADPTPHRINLRVEKAQVIGFWT